MHVGSLTLTLHIHECHSLKEKRHILKGELETARRKFEVSIAEVDDMDLWQKATIGVAAVSNDRRQLNRVLDAVREYFEQNTDFDVIGGELELDR